MVNVDERDVVHAHVKDSTSTLEKDLVTKIDKVKKKLTDRVRTTEKEHLSVPGIIGKNDNSEHETIYEYVKYHQDKHAATVAGNLDLQEKLRKQFEEFKKEVSP